MFTIYTTGYAGTSILIYISVLKIYMEWGENAFGISYNMSTVHNISNDSGAYNLNTFLTKNIL